jgi:phenylalanine-4-hydroxylase
MTWRLMFDQQLPQVQKLGTRLYLEGMDKIGLTTDHIPNFTELNERFKQLVGWELVSTDIQYSSGQDWFEALARKEFLITEYIRDRKDLSYTPLPDIFHDTFGHLPFMANQWYADYIHRFALHAIQYTPEQRKSLGSLWWYTIEFGLIREDGKLKALGAGLMSSYAELQRAYTSEVNLVPYSLEAFENVDPSPHEFHRTLFVLDSYDQLENSVEDWVKSHPPEKVAALH